MIMYLYFWVRFFLGFSILIMVYIYSIKVYGLKVTLITNSLLAGFVIVNMIFFYSAVPLGSDLPANFKQFFFTDITTIFPSFMITFELGRISLKKTKGNFLTNKDILYISLIVSFYGFCFQMLTDPTAAALRIYYYANPPELNIFGYPIAFLMSFTIYGLWGGIFLLLEKRNSIKKVK